MMAPTATTTETAAQRLTVRRLRRERHPRRRVGVRRRNPLGPVALMVKVKVQALWGGARLQGEVGKVWSVAAAAAAAPFGPSTPRPVTSCARTPVHAQYPTPNTNTTHAQYT